MFACNVEKGGFFYELLAAQPRGTSDTSRIATDHINNPNAINPIFLLAERERIAVPEKMAGGTLALPGEKEEMPVAAHSEGRRGFDRRPRRDHSRLRQHRNVFRILADATQSIDRADAAEAVRNPVCARAFRLLARDRRTSRQTSQRSSAPETISSGRRSRWQRLHHDRPSGHDARESRFSPRVAPRVIRANSRRRNIDPQSGEGKPWFRRRGDETGFSGKQFSLERAALSRDQD